MKRIPDAELKKMEGYTRLPQETLRPTPAEMRRLIQALREAYQEIGLLLARTSTPATIGPSITITNAEEWTCPTCWGVIVPGVPHSCAGGEP